MLSDAVIDVTVILFADNVWMICIGLCDVIPDGVRRCVSAPLYGDVTDGDDVRALGRACLPWLRLP